MELTQRTAYYLTMELVLEDKDMKEFVYDVGHLNHLEIISNTWNICSLIWIHCFICYSLWEALPWIITAAIAYVGGGVSGKGKNQGVYVDPNYVRRSPRKRQPGSQPSTPNKSGGPTPPKQGRPQRFHPDRKCGDCTIWLQLGSPEHLKMKHSTQNGTRHPNEKYVEWQAWLLKGGESIDIRYDSCLCTACYLDCNIQGKEKPRYYYQLHPASSKMTEKHCIVCHLDEHHPQTIVNAKL